MKIFYISLVLILLFISYFLILPLFKKRPVVLKETEIIIFFISTLGFYQFFGIWIFISTILGIILLFLLKPWLIYGITKKMLSDSLERSATMTRTSYEKNTNKHIIDLNFKIKQYSMSKKITILFFKKKSKSKKAKLTIILFNKLIQNFFIR
jgi:hypothetical protein